MIQKIKTKKILTMQKDKNQPKKAMINLIKYISK